MKFGRTYTMTVQTDPLTRQATVAPTPRLSLPPAVPFQATVPSVDNSVVINYPLTVQFDINRSCMGSANTGRFRILNLKEDTRRRIFRDRWETTVYRQMIFRAGYEGQKPLPIAFVGNIQEAQSHRQGPDWVTEIEAFDGGKAITDSQVSQTFPAGSSTQAIIAELFKGLQNVTPGAIGNFDGETGRGVSIMGNPWNVLQNTVANDGMCFIDNERVNAIKHDEFIENAGGILLINSGTGLLNTPRRHNTMVDVDVLFEPRVVIGQKVRLKSVESINDGDYQVLGIHHVGTISGAVAEKAMTTLSLRSPGSLAGLGISL